MFDFFTPEIFDKLVIANLLVALGLIAFRFTRDMTRPVPSPEDQRQQTHDEASTSALEDTSPNPAITGSSDTPSAQPKQNRSK